MDYKGFEITTKPHFITHRNKYHFYYGRGTSKTSAYCDTKQQAKAFIDWIIVSDYSTLFNEYTSKAYWRYFDLCK